MEQREFPIKFGGKTYVIKEPTVKDVHVLMKLSNDYQEASENLGANPDDSNLADLHDKLLKKLALGILTISNEVDMEEFDKLSPAQLDKLAITAMQFIGSGFTEGKVSGS